MSEVEEKSSNVYGSNSLINKQGYHKWSPASLMYPYLSTQSYCTQCQGSEAMVKGCQGTLYGICGATSLPPPPLGLIQSSLPILPLVILDVVPGLRHDCRWPGDQCSKINFSFSLANKLQITKLFSKLRFSLD